MSKQGSNIIKKTCDNDTLFYIFQSNPQRGFAIDRKAASKPWEHYFSNTLQNNFSSMNTYYHFTIAKRCLTDHCYTIFYKNNNGVWVDYNKLRSVFPSMMIADSAIKYENEYRINPQLLPACIFHDKDHFEYEIDICDGNPDGQSTVPIEIDQYGHSEIDIHNSHINKVLIEQCKIGERLAFKDRHLMEDIKLTLPVGRKKDDFLVWLNGAFQPTIPDSEVSSNSFENVMYIKDGLLLTNTTCLNQKERATLKEVSDKNATIIEDPQYNEYRYNFNIRLFGWKDVKVGNWIRPTGFKFSPVFFRGASLSIVDTLIFDSEINQNAHLIICNGQILQPEEYYIDQKDKRVVHLTKVIEDAYALILEYDTIFTKNSSFYENINVLEFLKPTLSSKIYSIVPFSHVDPRRSVHLIRSKSNLINHPYMHEVTFNHIDPGDLVLINGIYTPYEWIHQNTIFFPNYDYLFYNDFKSVKSTDIERLHFLVK